MDPIKIGTTISAERIHNIIEEIPRKKFLDINYEEYKNRYVYSFNLNKRKSEDNLSFFDILSKLINEIIQEFYIKDMIKRRLNKLHSNINAAEVFELLNEAYDIIRDEGLFTAEKDNITKEIRNYLIENKLLIIDGYLIFRPQIFNILIDKVIDMAIYNIQLDEEYEEFIEMLKYFVDASPSEIELVNLIWKENEFQLLDKDNKKIRNDYIVSTLEDLFHDEINKADIVLSTLIGLSPERIIVHLEEDKEIVLIDILKRIFVGRVELCSGCKLCKAKLNMK